MINAIYKPIASGIKKTRWPVLLTGTLITLLVAMLDARTPAYLSLLELKLYDAVFSQTYSGAKTDSVAIVDIDDASLARFGQWPWPRYRVALLLQKINMAGARAVGLDILFAEPDGTSPLVMKRALKTDLKVDVQFSGLPAPLMDNDAVLGNVLSMGPYVLGYSMVFTGAATPSAEPAQTQVPAMKFVALKTPGARSPGDHLFQAKDLISPLPVLMAGAGRAGYMNTVTDKDGVLRRTPLFISWNGRIYPQLSLATLMAALGKNPPVPVIKTSRNGIESIKLGSTVIPLEANGAMLINYRGPSRTFPYISAADILNDTQTPGVLKGKIIFVGTSAAGLKDIRVSPLDEVYPGVEVHATMTDNILSQDFIQRPYWTPGLEFCIVLVWGVVTTLLIGWTSALFTIPVTFLLGAAAWYGGMIGLDRFNIWVSPFFPIMVLGLNFSVLNMQRFWLSEKKKKFFRSAFSKYVSSAVVDQLADNPDKLSLEGEEKHISILFSDIRSFTSISEQISPSQITELLHDYFTPVTRIIIDHHGTHDKFIGDAVMCFWNAPVDVPDHQGHAIRAALEMLAGLRDLNKGFKEKFGIEIAVGIGLHSGLCRVGNMGSDDIFDYTIIGDNVNLASRLESLTKFYGVELIISQDMAPGLTDALVVQELDRVRVKGKDTPVSIFTVFSPDAGTRPALEAEINAHDQALAHYKAGAFEKALLEFKRLGTTFSDRKIYRIYQERCILFQEEPPGEDWDGVFTHTSK